MLYCDCDLCRLPIAEPGCDCDACRPPGDCLCVGSSPADRCRAIQELIRPQEVAHLIRRVPLHQLPADHTLARSVARYVATELVYVPDPPNCDLWCSPARTLHRRRGDCDDFAIFSASALLAGRVDAAVIVGLVFVRGAWRGHAWVEGVDHLGWFLLEATSGTVYRRERPSTYIAQLELRPGSCCVAQPRRARVPNRQRPEPLFP